MLYGTTYELDTYIYIYIDFKPSDMTDMFSDLCFVFVYRLCFLDLGVSMYVSCLFVRLPATTSVPAGTDLRAACRLVPRRRSTSAQEPMPRADC